MLPFAIAAQDAKPKKEKDKAPASSHLQRKKAKQKWKETRIIEKGQRDAITEHDKKIQTKKTLKRMKQERRKSEKLRANKKENSFIKWVKKKWHY